MARLRRTPFFNAPAFAIDDDNHSEIPNSYVLYVALKDSDACAKKLTRAISENIGSDLSIHFKSRLLMTSRIVSGINTEKGFGMTLADENLVNDIVAFYR